MRGHDIRGQKYTNMVLGAAKGVLFIEVSSFQGILIRGMSSHLGVLIRGVSSIQGVHSTYW